MKYNYTEMKENEHSYDNFDLRMTNEVPAVYVRSKMPEDNGNPYIEALPEARTEDEVFTTYNKQPLFPNEKEVINEQLSRIQLVVQIRNNVLLCANTEKQLMIWERKNEKIRIISISIMKPINMIMVDRNAVIYINECKEIKCISI